MVFFVFCRIILLSLGSVAVWTCWWGPSCKACSIHEFLFFSLFLAVVSLSFFQLMNLFWPEKLDQHRWLIQKMSNLCSTCFSPIIWHLIFVHSSWCFNKVHILLGTWDPWKKSGTHEHYSLCSKQHYASKIASAKHRQFNIPKNLFEFLEIHLYSFRDHKSWINSSPSIKIKINELAFKIRNSHTYPPHP